jgi:RHS repeat-associated protein
LESTNNDAEKWATYYRDQKTGFDHAINRYYWSGLGRFLSPDPYVTSGGAAEPQNWNRYAYVKNDPANWNDPRGLYRQREEPWDEGGGGWPGIFSVPFWGPDGYAGSYFVFPVGLPAVPSLGGGGGGSRNLRIVLAVEVRLARKQERCEKEVRQGYEPPAY